MSETHFRYLPSTRKLIARLKREVNGAAALCAAAERWNRTPQAQRGPVPAGAEMGVGRYIPARATVLCATLAHIRGRVHAGKWTPVGQVEWIGAHMNVLLPHQREMVHVAVGVPAREKARLRSHQERKLANQEQNAPERARRCGAV